MLCLVLQGSPTWPWSVSSTSRQPRLGVAKAEAAWGRHMQPARKPPPISVPPQYLQQPQTQACARDVREVPVGHESTPQMVDAENIKQHDKHD